MPCWCATGQRMLGDRGCISNVLPLLLHLHSKPASGAPATAKSGKKLLLSAGFETILGVRQNPKP
jgi:hypothetical protein